MSSAVPSHGSPARTVLVTGSSSGIGQATAIELDRLGFRVFAGVRRQSDADRLKAMSSAQLTPVILDVAQQSSVDAAMALVAEEVAPSGLWGLVNVAGIADFGPAETISADRLLEIFQVNFFGALRVTQAAIPLMRRKGGRIVNVGSVGAHTTIPFGVSICSSKHALESLTSALRMELAPWNIDVIAVDPSSIATSAADRMIDQAERTMTDTFSATDREHYEDALRLMATSMHAQEMSGLPPQGVAEVIAKALTRQRPRTRYPVGPKAGTLVRLSGILPDRLFDRMKMRMLGIRMSTPPEG